MKKSIFAIYLCATFCAHHANAGTAIDHSLQASKHSVLAVTEGVGSAVIVASAVVAVPLIVVGSAVAHSGKAVAKAMHHEHDAELIVTEITITVDPAPNKAVKSSQIQH